MYPPLDPKLLDARWEGWGGRVSFHAGSSPCYQICEAGCLGVGGEGCFVGSPRLPQLWVPFTSVWRVSQPVSQACLVARGQSSSCNPSRAGGRTSLRFWIFCDETSIQAESYLHLPALPSPPWLSLPFGPLKQTRLSCEYCPMGRWCGRWAGNETGRDWSAKAALTFSVHARNLVSCSSLVHRA